MQPAALPALARFDCAADGNTYLFTGEAILAAPSLATHGAYETSPESQDNLAELYGDSRCNPPTIEQLELIIAGLRPDPPQPCFETLARDLMALARRCCVV